MTVLKLSSIVVGVLVLSGVGYLQHPVFGQIPEGERLRQIQDSPNYTDGEFKNLIETLHADHRSVPTLYDVGESDRRE